MSESNAQGAGGANTVWLASYPKSGNTWLRAIITAVRSGDHLFAVNQLSFGAQPNHVGSASFSLALDPRWLDRTELLVLRDSLISSADRASTEGARSERSQSEDAQRGEVEALDVRQGDLQQGEARSEDPSSGPIFRKTHEVFRPGEPGREPFPLRATSAAILVVRDPRSVVCSSAPFFGITLDKAADRMGRAKPGKSSPAASTTPQPWGSWSSHCESWLGADVPFPVHLVRYEDLKSNAVEVLLPVLAAVGFDVTRQDLERAVKRTSFERLVSDESESGFREVSAKTEKFFRQGRTDAWRDELSPELIDRIESDHGDMMTRLGYEWSADGANLADQVNLRDEPADGIGFDGGPAVGANIPDPVDLRYR